MYKLHMQTHMHICSQTQDTYINKHMNSHTYNQVNRPKRSPTACHMSSACRWFWTSICLECAACGSSRKTFARSSGTERYCGGTKSISRHSGTPLGNHGKPLPVGIYRRIIVPGFLRWREMDFVHPQFDKRPKQGEVAGESLLPRRPSIPLWLPFETTPQSQPGSLEDGVFSARGFFFSDLA